MGYLSKRKISEKDNMMLEIKQLMAFLFQRSGKAVLSGQDIYMVLSYELGWMTPDEAKKTVIQACELGIIQEGEGGYLPNFDCQKVHVPLGFHINWAVIQKASVGSKSSDVVDDVVVALAEKGIAKQDAREEIRITAQHQHIILEAAALVVARRYNLNTMSYYSRALDAIKKL
jgi:hypothetical protein